MKDEDRLIEIMAELLAEVHEMRTGMNERLDKVNHRLERVEHKIEGLEKQQAKTNLAIGELRLSVMKLANREVIINDHAKRIRRLESSHRK